MIAAIDPDIPRWIVASTEWMACVAYIALARPRLRVGILLPVTAAGLGALLAVHLWGERFPLDLWTLGMLAGIATMFTLILGASRGGLKQAGDLTARAFVLAELAASLSWQLQQFFHEGQAETAADGTTAIAMCAAGVAIGYAIERRQFRSHEPLAVAGRPLATALGIAVITFAVSNLSFVAGGTPFSARLGPEMLYVRTLVDLCGFAALYAHRGHQLEMTRAIAVDRMDLMLRNQHQRYLQAEHDTDVVNRKYHDLKHYIHALRSEPDQAVRAGYVDRLEESIRSYEASVVSTGSNVLDTIIASSAAQAARSNVEFIPMVDGGVVAFVDPLDLVSIVGNALDNALEAAAAVPEPEHRLVRFSLFAQGAFAMIRAENYFEGDQEFVDGLPRTTKGDTKFHGFGLRSIRATAERYDGSLTVHAEDHWFTVRVLLPLP